MGRFHVYDVACFQALKVPQSLTADFDSYPRHNARDTKWQMDSVCTDALIVYSCCANGSDELNIVSSMLLE